MYYGMKKSINKSLILIRSYNLEIYFVMIQNLFLHLIRRTEKTRRMIGHSTTTISILSLVYIYSFSKNKEVYLLHIVLVNLKIISHNRVVRKVSSPTRLTQL